MSNFWGAVHGRSSFLPLFRIQAESRAPRLARVNGPKPFGRGIGGVGGVRGPCLRLGTAVGHLPSVVPQRPVGRLLVDLVAGSRARAQVLDQRAAERFAVHVDLAQRADGAQRQAVRFVDGKRRDHRAETVA